MVQQLPWIFAWNILINSMLMFLTVSLLVHLALRVLRIQNPRLLMLGFLLPFCKLGFDLFSYRFSEWALLQGINPLEALPGTRTLSLTLHPFFASIQLHMQDGLSFSVADGLALALSPFWIVGMVLSAGVGTLLTGVFFAIRFRREQRQVDSLVQEAFSFTPLFKRPRLQDWTQKRSLRFALSEAIASPCVIGSTILFPVHLHKNLSQEELEAIIAHESAHIQWRDSYIRIGTSFLASLFWWIPTQWHLKELMQMQEKGADRAVLKWGIPAASLIDALLKTLKTSSCKAPLQQAIYFGATTNSLQQRLLSLLKPLSKRTCFIRNSLFIGILFTLLVGRLWIF